jgi:putative DNA primase/helicase
VSSYPLPAKRATLVLAANVEREAVDWLWPGRIARRSVSLLVGDPGLGKSLLTCALTAELSRAGEFAVIATAEDSLSATARPRLEAAQAELERVAFVQMQADDGLPASLFLPDDLDELEGRVEEAGPRSS